MKHSSILFVLLTLAPTAFAWDPMGALQGALQQQTNRQIQQSVAEVFRSVSQPSVSRRSNTAEIQGASGEIVMYATPHCGYCKQARAHLQSRGIAYLEKDVSSDRAAESEFRALGGRGVPLIILGSRQLTGFSPASFDKTYAEFQAEQARAAAPAPANTAANSPVTHAAAQPALAVGDVLATRIARVRLLADAHAQAKSVAQLAKQEEVVYLGETRNRFLRVRSAAAEGWVDQALLVKPGPANPGHANP